MEIRNNRKLSTFFHYAGAVGVFALGFYIIVFMSTMSVLAKSFFISLSFIVAGGIINRSIAARFFGYAMVAVCLLVFAGSILDATRNGWDIASVLLYGVAFVLTLFIAFALFISQPKPKSQ